MVRYELIDSNGDSHDAELGNGDVITLDTDELTDSRTFKIKATTLPSTAGKTTNHPYEYLDLDTELTIEVHPLPLSLIPEYPLPVHVGFPAKLKLKSYKDVSYQLKSAERSIGHDNNPISESVAGTGDNITLTTYRGLQPDRGLHKDTHVQVWATIAPLIDRPPEASVREVLSGSTTLYVVYPKSSITLPQPNISNTNE